MACLLLLVAALPAWAHPGVGLVMDRQGNVFYTDLTHVWRIAPDGSKSIAVRNVHTHELALDSADNLFGEDSEYLGGDRYRHRIWRRSPNGRITDVVPWREGFWREYGFVHDRAGAMYWVQCPDERCVIRKRTPGGRTTTVAPGVRLTRNVAVVNWLAVAPDGSVYFPDGRDLCRLDPRGRLTTVAPGLAPRTPVHGNASELHSLLGMQPDAQGNIYVANYAGRSVVRVSPAGHVALVARAPAPWSPSGVLVAPNGDLWILEYSTSNQARVRRVARNGRTTVF
jgi:hypothetical protein